MDPIKEPPSTAYSGYVEKLATTRDDRLPKVANNHDVIMSSQLLSNVVLLSDD